MSREKTQFLPFLKTEIRYTLTKHCRTVIKPKYRKINSLTPIIPKLSLSSNFILEQETDENSINRKGKQRGGDLNQTKQTLETPGFELQSAPSDIDLDLESIPSLDVKRKAPPCGTAGEIGENRVRG